MGVHINFPEKTPKMIRKTPKVNLMLWKRPQISLFKSRGPATLFAPPRPPHTGHFDLKKLTNRNCPAIKKIIWASCLKIKVWSFIMVLNIFTIVNIKKGPTITDSASYSMSSCPFSIVIAIPEWFNDFSYANKNNRHLSKTKIQRLHSIFLLCRSLGTISQPTLSLNTWFSCFLSCPPKISLFLSILSTIVK